MLVPILAAFVLAGIHVLADRLKLSGLRPQMGWLSGASGVSVAFVFLLLLPELAARQEVFAAMPALGFLDHHVWLIALVGLVAFYGVEHWMLAHGKGRPEASHGAFWGHIGIFAIYNVVIGYLLFNPHPDVVEHVLVYAAALGLHLLIIDTAMRRHHAERYHRFGRWVMAAAVLVGAAAGVVADVHDGLVAAALAILAGGIVLNALKEELPEEREGRVVPFAAGALALAAVIALTAQL
jgi:hypothetical protein